MQLHVAVVLALDDDKVVELDVVALDGLAEFEATCCAVGRSS
jgi:hypothetical protein